MNSKSNKKVSKDAVDCKNCNDSYANNVKDCKDGKGKCDKKDGKCQDGSDCSHRTGVTNSVKRSKEDSDSKEYSGQIRAQIELPPYTPQINPTVPNRAWTAMKQGMDIDSLTEDEKADLYLGRDNYF